MISTSRTSDFQISGSAISSHKNIQDTKKRRITLFSMMWSKLNLCHEVGNIPLHEQTLNNWCFRIWHRKAYRSDYVVEADMLNTIVTGKTSQQLKSEYGVASNDLIRDYLKKEHNEELLFLEQQNQVLLLMDMGFTERKNMLTKMHKVKFKSTEKVVAA